MDEMNDRDFKYWLRGFFELSGGCLDSDDQLEAVRDHINLVEENSLLFFQTTFAYQVRNAFDFSAKFRMLVDNETINIKLSDFIESILDKEMKKVTPDREILKTETEPFGFPFHGHHEYVTNVGPISTPASDVKIVCSTLALPDGVQSIGFGKPNAVGYDRPVGSC
tara:strand:- start:1270 stop:1767 length:498 start_codon:yes stop_codon:yes gene_type:complete